MTTFSLADHLNPYFGFYIYFLFIFILMYAAEIGFDIGRLIRIIWQISAHYSVVAIGYIKELYVILNIFTYCSRYSNLAIVTICLKKASQKASFCPKSSFTSI